MAINTLSKFSSKLSKVCLCIGSGCGAVRRAVASDTRGPRLKSSHWQKFILILNICLLSTLYLKDGNKEKEAVYGPFFLKKVCLCKFTNGSFAQQSFA